MMLLLSTNTSTPTILANTALPVSDSIQLSFLSSQPNFRVCVYLLTVANNGSTVATNVSLASTH